VLTFPGLAQAQLTNSWTYQGSFFWDNPAVWSLGVAPSNNQSLILITNSVIGGSAKSVNLDSLTASQSPGTMTISNLTVFAPAGLTNIVSLNSVGVLPLRILNAFTIGAGGALFATNSTARVEGVSGGTLVDNGKIDLVNGGALAVLTTLRIGNFGCTIVGTVNVTGGSLFVTNAAGTAMLEVRGGTVTLSAGVLKADQLVVTNSCARFIHTGGTLSVTSTNLSAGFDADGDGLPNGWEQQYKLDPFDPAGNNGPNGDPDGDGFTNLQEYLAGTDPTNNASAPRITAVTREGNSIRIAWLTGLGKTNALQAATGGAYFTNNFAEIFSVTNATGSATNYLDGGAATNRPARYYRVRLVP
jgi:hypothetical protein